jgi:hypothetical protein
MNAEISSEIRHVDGGRSPETKIPTTRRSPALSYHCETARAGDAPAAVS